MKKVPANSEYIAAMLGSVAGNLSPGEELDFEDKHFLTDYNDTCDQYSLKSAYHLFEKVFEIEIGRDKWKQFVKNSKPVGYDTLCEFLIGCGVQMPQWTDQTGNVYQPCGGEILDEIKNIIRDKGLEYGEIDRQTPVDELLNKHCDLFICDIAGLCPQNMPVVCGQSSGGLWAVFVFLIIFAVLTVIVVHSALTMLFSLGTIILVIVFIAKLSAAENSRLWFDDIKTFGELADRLAGDRCSDVSEK